MPKKSYRKYTFSIKRTKLEPEIIFTTVAKDSHEAIMRTSERLQMDVTDMFSIEPRMVSKLIYRKEGYVFTKDEVKRIKKQEDLKKAVSINLTPFAYLNTGALRTMISKLKRSSNVRGE